MIPGKTYKPEDFLQIGWRRKWLVVVPFLVTTIGTVIYSNSLPNLYRAETLIQAIPQRVPESFVRSTVTLSIQDRLQAITQQIFSRTRLERTVEEFHLYPQARRTEFMENIVERMRNDVGVSMVSGNSFRVSFVSGDPQTALKVTERLTSFFLEANLRDRASLAEGTTEFLETELDEARQRLIAQEKKLEEYRRRHAGELPSQVDSNLQAIQTHQLQMQALTESINRDRDRRLVLEKLLLEAKNKGAEEPAAPDSAQPASAVESRPLAAQLETARKTREALLVRLKPEHPDVIQAERIIRELEGRLEAEALEGTLEAEAKDQPPVARPTKGKTSNQLRIEEMEGQIAELDTQLAKKQADELDIRASMVKFQARVEGMPTRESEMVQLMRDYGTLQEGYTSLLRKNQESKISENLERRQISEQFKVIDSARLPERPFSPDRLRMNLMGALVGLGIGVALIALLEYRDTTLKNEEDVVVSLVLPVIAMVPMLRPRIGRQLLRR